MPKKRVEDPLARLELKPDILPELKRLAEFYRNEAEKCRSAGAFLAGCIMMGAYLETLLTLTVYADRKNVASFGNGPNKDLLDWGLSDLMKVAEKLNWIPRQIAPEREIFPDYTTTLGSLAILIQDYRNLVHPGNYCKNAPLAAPLEEDFSTLVQILWETASNILVRPRTELDLGG